MPSEGKMGPLARGPKKGAKEGTRVLKHGKGGSVNQPKKGGGKKGK